MPSQSADLSTQNSFMIPARHGATTAAEAHALLDAAAIWLRDHLNGRYGLYSDGEVTFEHVADAVAFKLAWGEAISEVVAHNQERNESILRRVTRRWNSP